MSEPMNEYIADQTPYENVRLLQSPRNRQSSVMCGSYDGAAPDVV